MLLDTKLSLARYGNEESCLNGLYRVQSDSAKRVKLQREVDQGAAAPGMSYRRKAGLQG